MAEAMNDPLFLADLREVVEDFRHVDSLDLESIRERSRLTEEQAAVLADEVNRRCWGAIKRKFVDVGREKDDAETVQDHR
jgi:hypothetical protein